MASKINHNTHLAGLLAKSAHERVTICAAASAIIVVLNDNGLLACKPAGEQDDHLTRLQKTNKSTVCQPPIEQ